MSSARDVRLARAVPLPGTVSGGAAANLLRARSHGAGPDGSATAARKHYMGAYFVRQRDQEYDDALDSGRQKKLASAKTRGRDAGLFAAGHGPNRFQQQYDRDHLKRHRADYGDDYDESW